MNGPVAERFSLKGRGVSGMEVSKVDALGRIGIFSLFMQNNTFKDVILLLVFGMHYSL